jgi:hypothetical protein
MEIGSSALLERNFLVVRNFLDQPTAKQLAAEFKVFAAEHGHSDELVPESLNWYNCLPFVRMMVDKIPQCEILSGLKLLPTYTYARHYNQTGAILPRHTDRPSCEVTLTVNLDKTVDWPIHIETADGVSTAIELEPGDAAMYLGCVSPHWREAYTGDDHVQVFIHYVDAYGPNANNFFDLQPALERKE